MLLGKQHICHRKYLIIIFVVSNLNSMNFESLHAPGVFEYPLFTHVLLRYLLRAEKNPREETADFVYGLHQLVDRSLSQSPGTSILGGTWNISVSIRRGTAIFARFGSQYLVAPNINYVAKRFKTYS
jgi:hypothetical protein